MKNRLLTVLLISISFSDLYGQKDPSDYDILNKLFPLTIRDSSKTFFLCEFNLDDNELANDLYYDMKLMADSLIISEEFKQYTQKRVAKKISKWKWNKNKVNYKYITTDKKKDRNSFSISRILFSKSKRYFFVVADHSTHTACAIFEILDNGSIKILNEEGLRIKTPFFR